jgi:hypothetical protein
VKIISDFLRGGGCALRFGLHGNVGREDGFRERAAVAVGDVELGVYEEICLAFWEGSAYVGFVAALLGYVSVMSCLRKDVEMLMLDGMCTASLMGAAEVS